jgi:MFS family permease
MATTNLLRTNWRQFTLLVIVNACVGAVLGVERSVVPLIAAREFAITSTSVTLSFIISFGVIKAIANLFTGWAADTYGRRRMLIIGWLIGIPVPWLMWWAPNWGWIIAANILLGINQGLCWSAAVIMKIDLAGARQRGLAMGLNEFAGYLAMSLASIGAGFLASQYGLRPVPLLLSATLITTGLLISLIWVRDTTPRAATSPASTPPAWRTLFLQASWHHRRLASFNFAGHVNNLNDVIIWGLLPLRANHIGIALPLAASIGALYLAVWGIGQLASGHLSDRLGRTPLIISGMWVQAAGIAIFGATTTPTMWSMAAVLMGAGTALVYPTLLAAVSDVAEPQWRASMVGIYRFWRDAGYAMGALIIGVAGDLVGTTSAVWFIAALTASAGVSVWYHARSQ